MSGFVFVCDADQRPLMPMAAAYARRLLRTGRAKLRPHHALTILQLSHTIPNPHLRPIMLKIEVHFNTAELLLLAEGERAHYTLARFIVDLRTDLVWRLRRRAGFRRRRRARGRYRAPSPFGLPFKLQHPSLRTSIWATPLRRARRQPLSRPHVPAIIQWRAEAIERVVMALRKYVPVSSVIIATSAPYNRTSAGRLQAELRQDLVDTYGHISISGQREAVCFYCLSTEGRIEIDHVIPLSRGGTDHWANLALACAQCNHRKQGRTPTEAGMELIIQSLPEPIQFERAKPYINQTVRQLAIRLRQYGVKVGEPNKTSQGQTPTTNQIQMLNEVPETDQDVLCFIAHPVSRPRKQMFTGRNYPATTEQTRVFARVGEAVKRRVRVNEGIARLRQGDRVIIQVVQVGSSIPSDTEQFFCIGMLCKARRAQRDVVGVIKAVHSDGRLTLMRPVSAHKQRVEWERVVVSPRREAWVMSTDRVLFFSLPSDKVQGSPNSQ